MIGWWDGGMVGGGNVYTADNDTQVRAIKAIPGGGDESGGSLRRDDTLSK